VGDAYKMDAIQCTHPRRTLEAPQAIFVKG